MDGAAEKGEPQGERPRRTFAERYRLLRTRWNEEWWSIAFGGPIGNLLNALLADIPWITPNAITIVGFLCKVVGGPLLLVGTDTADWIAVVLLQLNTVCDCMDGSLARYRRSSSLLGSFLDKATDQVGLLCVMAALGWRVYGDSGDAGAIVVAILAGASVCVRSYFFWVVAYMERERGVERPTLGVDNRIDFSTLTAGQRFRLYVRSMTRILSFSESDLYFWIGLGVLLGRAHEAVYFLGGALAIAFVGIGQGRLRRVLQLERVRRPL